MPFSDYGFDPQRLHAALKEQGLTAAAVNAAVGLSGNMVGRYLAGTGRPSAQVLPRLSRAVGLADPLDLCDLGDGERIVHLRVRVGKSRAQIAGDLGWEKQTYMRWENSGRAWAKMQGLREPEPGQPIRPDSPRTPFFTRPVLQPGAMVDGDWRDPVYGPLEYGNPEHFAAFQVPAERLALALQRTRDYR